MRVPLLVGEGVMLAVHGDPLTGHQADGHPEHEPEAPLDDRVEHERAVSGATVQIDGGGEGGGLGDRRREKQHHDHGCQQIALQHQPGSLVHDD